jgi:hypothetical protein
MVKRSREEFDSDASLSIPDPTASPSLSPSPASEAISSSAPESAKLIHLDLEGGEDLTKMLCSLPGHRPELPFQSFDAYELHYNKIHVNRCVECRKNFPTAHFLNLHQAENHDPLVSVLKERGEHTFACFVQDCDRKCSTHQKRRMHMIDKHMFPKDYDFYIVNNGIDQRNSMLRSRRHRRKSSITYKLNNEGRARRRGSTFTGTGPDEDTDVDNGTLSHNASDAMQLESISDIKAASPTSKKDAEMESLAGAMSSLKFVPTSVQFGRGKGRAGFSKT